MMGYKDILCLIIMTAFLFVASGCGDPAGKGPAPATAGGAGAPQTEKAGGDVVPADGTPGERVKKLWESTSPMIKADARAKIVDREYQEKRTPLFSAWVMLQGKLSLAEQKDEQAQRVIPEVLKMIDNLYGFPGFDADRRAKDRETAKKYFDERFQKLDLRIKALK